MIINCLNDCNLRQTRDYILMSASHGCFNIALCPHRFAVIDIQYFYDNIPDIVVFRLKQKKEYVNIVIKVRLRGD